MGLLLYFKYKVQKVSDVILSDKASDVIYQDTHVIFTLCFIPYYILLPSSCLIYETVFQTTRHAYCQYDVTI
jgi:hypothetical protein